MPNRYKNKKDVNSGVFGIKTGLFLGFNPNAFSLKFNNFYNRHFHLQHAIKRLQKKKYQGLSAALLLSALVGALRSTPQPPYRHFSFAWQIFYGGFAGYLLLSPSPSAVESLLGFYYNICFL